MVFVLVIEVIIVLCIGHCLVFNAVSLIDSLLIQTSGLVEIFRGHTIINSSILLDIMMQLVAVADTDRLWVTCTE